MAGATATGEIGRIDSGQSHEANPPKSGTRGLIVGAVVVVAAAFGVAFAAGSATKGSTTKTTSSQLAPATSVQGQQKVAITAVGAAPAVPNLKSAPKPPAKHKSSSSSSQQTSSSSNQQTSSATQRTQSSPAVQPTHTTPAVQPTHTTPAARRLRQIPLRPIHVDDAAADHRRRLVAVRVSLRWPCSPAARAG